MWQNCMMHENGDESSHRWECTFDNPGINPDIESIGGDESKQIVIEGYENVNEFMELNSAVSGDSVLVMTNPEIQTDRVVVKVDDVIGIEALDFDDSVDRKPPKKNSRKLAAKAGNLTALVIRVSTLDTTPTDSAQEISDDVFGDDWCLKTQYERCSYGKLTIMEYVPGDSSGYNVPTAAAGVVEVSVNINATEATTDDVQELANKELEKMFNKKLSEIRGQIDLHLFIFPPIKETFLAYAYVGRQDSYYSDRWGQMLSAQMHEVGHSIGLKHSGEYSGNVANLEYGDQTGYMGFSFKQDDAPKMCFNPAKNWQLEWYLDKQIEVNPDVLSVDNPTTYKLSGIVDYQDSPNFVVLKIGEFYVGYNMAKEFNIGTEEGANMVVVNEKMGSRKSKLAAKLSIGESSILEITTQLSVKVTYVVLENDKDAVIEIIVVGEPPECQGDSDEEIVVELKTDNYPQEISWAITNSVGIAVYRSGSYSNQNFESTETVPGLCAGLEYSFVISDSFGDGICCKYGAGTFVGKYGDLELFSGGEFEYEDTKPFMIPVPTEAPTSSPTTAPTATTGDCVDDPDWIYRGKPWKKCSTWVKEIRKSGNRKTVCKRRANTDKLDQRKVYSYCKATCHDVGIKQACP